MAEEVALLPKLTKLNVGPISWAGLRDSGLFYPANGERDMRQRLHHRITQSVGDIPPPDSAVFVTGWKSRLRSLSMTLVPDFRDDELGVGKEVGIIGRMVD